MTQLRLSLGSHFCYMHIYIVDGNCLCPTLILGAEMGFEFEIDFISNQYKAIRYQQCISTVNSQYSREFQRLRMGHVR